MRGDSLTTPSLAVLATRDRPIKRNHSSMVELTPELACLKTLLRPPSADLLPRPTCQDAAEKVISTEMSLHFATFRNDATCRSNSCRQQSEYYIAMSAALDFESLTERTRLSPPALKAFAEIARRWSLSEMEMRGLLAVPQSQPIFHSNGDPLSPDQLLRMSYLIGIFKALQIVYTEPLASRWIRLPNSNVLFGGLAPLDMMVSGGIDAMRTVRKLLDARSVSN